MKSYDKCALCGKPFPKVKRERTYPHKRIEPASAAYESMGRVLHEAKPEREVTDYLRPVIVSRPITPQDGPYYPFCTLRCGWDYGATVALGADIYKVREKIRQQKGE